MNSKKTFIDILKQAKEDMPKKPRAKQEKDKDLDYIKNTTYLIKEIRLKSGITQPELTWETGMVQQSISSIDTNKINPRLSTIKRYLEACGIDLDELLRKELIEMEDSRLNKDTKKYPKDFSNLFVWENECGLGAGKTEFENIMLNVLGLRIKFYKLVELDGTVASLFFIHKEDISKLEETPFSQCIIKWDESNETHRMYMSEELSH